MDQRVVIHEFNSRGEAEIVRELLWANGIESFVVSDDCGAVDPALSFARGVQLYVAADDAPLAKQIIADSMTETQDDEENRSDQQDSPS